MMEFLDLLLSKFIPLWSLLTCWGGGKGGGGGSAPPTSQTVTQTNLPEYAQPYFERLMSRAEGVTQQPYPTYQGPRLADLSTNQQTAIQGAGIVGAQAPGQIQAGAGLTTAAGLGGLNTGTFDQAAANQYMSPYIGSVLNEYQRQADINQSNIGLQAAQQGALGGYRQGIMQTEAQRNADQLKLQALNQGFGMAQQQYNADQSRRLQGLGLAGQSGAQLGQFGQQGLLGLQTTGALSQQQNQAALDLAYSDFINSMNYPKQQLNFMSGILRGVPTTANQDVQQFTAPPSPYSQLLGLGIAGAGVGKLIGGS